MFSVIQTAFLLFVACSLPLACNSAIVFIRSTAWPTGLWWQCLLRSAKLPKGKRSSTLSSSKSARIVSVAEGMQLHKDLYFKLQNLERYPSILPQSRELLIQFFSEALANASPKSESGILSLKIFEPKALAKFLQAKDEKITLRWEQYMSRRTAGGPREMFKDLGHAKWWLKQCAPVKFVDGAWLGHIHKVTTPFPLRRITKNAWQVLSEELGDGDLTKNHVQIYRELMNDIRSGLPDGTSAEFIGERHGLNEPRVWKAALAQLLISLFPQEFLPEILGFNMHFEMLTWDTMRAIKELKELKLNDYYFLLHISIDNADSGHTAMAMQAVVDYVQHIKQADGPSAAQQAWKRVQAGFILSESLPSSPEYQSYSETGSHNFSLNEYEAEVIKVFKAKAPVAHKLHCGSKMTIQRRSLVDWLEPQAFESKQWQMEFLDALSNTKPWIRKGDSGRSKLIQELSWDGKMFGSFTQTEVEAVKRWIESLAVPLPDPKVYWSFVGRDELSSEQALGNQDVLVDYPVFSSIDIQHFQSAPRVLPPSALSVPIRTTLSPNLAKLLPLWFTHPCILESLITIPFKTTTPTASAIIRVLRAQYGFAAEGSGVAGMDEVRRLDGVGHVELGLEMMKRAGLPKAGSLKEVLEGRDSDFAVNLLHLSMRPIAHRDMLLGMAWTFMNLHDAIATSESMELLSAEKKDLLREMARREKIGLQVCLDELKGDQVRYTEFCRGFEMARGEIESCFG